MLKGDYFLWSKIEYRKNLNLATQFKHAFETQNMKINAMCLTLKQNQIITAGDVPFYSQESSKNVHALFFNSLIQGTGKKFIRTNGAIRRLWKETNMTIVAQSNFMAVYDFSIVRYRMLSGKLSRWSLKMNWETTAFSKPLLCKSVLNHMNHKMDSWR